MWSPQGWPHLSQVDLRFFLRARRRGWCCCECGLQEKNKRIGRKMKIEIHGRVDKQPETGNEGASMKGETPHIPLANEIPPAGPDPQKQKRQTAETANYACLCENLRVIVVAVIHDESVIHSFVKRK